jgi:hypothetical protein
VLSTKAGDVELAIPSSGRGASSPRSWNPDAGSTRPSMPWSWRPTCTGCAGGCTLGELGHQPVRGVPGADMHTESDQVASALEDRFGKGAALMQGAKE